MFKKVVINGHTRQKTNKKFLADTCPFVRQLVPLFWISGNISSGFQSQNRFCLIRCIFYGGKCNIHSLRSTFGATRANLLPVGITGGYFPTYISRGGTWSGFERAKTYRSGSFGSQKVRSAFKYFCISCYLIRPFCRKSRELIAL